MTEPRDFDAERRRIIRRITLWTWGVWGLVVFLAVAGGALLAWIFRGLGGFSFGIRWLLFAILLVAVPAAVHGVMRAAGRGRGAADDEP